MKICIDIRTVNKPKSGVGYYVSNLVRKFQEIDKDNYYLLISNIAELEPELRSLPNFENCKTMISNENHIFGDFWESFYLPRFLSRKGVNVFHGPAFMIPLRSCITRSVVTIHDIVAFIKPETVPLKYALYMRTLISLVVKKADMIITPSQSTKDDLMRVLGVSESKIVVTHEAVSESFCPGALDGGEDKIKSRFGIKNKYMLFVGNLEPRKNLIRLLKAYEMAKGRLGKEYQLVICGKKGWLYKNILKAVEDFSQNGDVILTSYVEDNDLLELYRGAEMFLFPTLYEGFGLPVLEAMASGTPVITSNVSSIPEIAGDAAYLIDPLSITDISNAIIKVAFSDTLRRSLREKGIKQATRFSWSQTAEKTLAVYRSII
ncbi:hypothetical protein MNBD_NITROSPINAE02-48 [hydrothermal vent metagenome]|uniref:Glycosyl transferase, group 1 n=1 Tax=hydrothermal vent metagenome TaxID=652676 RepID=A0A3B1BP35_9ZZZZ